MNTQKIVEPEVLKALINEEHTLAQIAEAIRKAAVTTSTYTFSPATRSIFVAENLDPVVKLIVPTATPIRSLLPRKAGSGQATAWKKLTSKLNYSTTGSAITFADGGVPNETTQTYQVVTAAYKLLGRKVSVGLLHVAASKDYLPVEDELIRIKTLEVMLGEEELIINGDSSIDPNAFDGLLRQITTNSATASFLTASGISAYDQTIFEAGGAADHLFLGPRQARALADELQQTGSIQRIIVSDQTGAIAYQKVSAIVSAVTGKTINLVTSRYMGSWAILGQIKSDAGENYVEMEDLIPLIKMDVPTTSFAKDSFIVEATVLKLIAEPYWYKIGGLAT
uniref:Phage major capsid protein n=1 Tax=Dictyoglomus turgidum TaxID=513050 RepID=A0A7C3WW43_9BACT